MIDIKARHEYWWNYLLERLPVPDDFDRTLPGIELTTKLSRTAGWAYRNRCVYNLNYAVQKDVEYDETVCHEICHVFVDRIPTGKYKGHTSLWYYLYNVVCQSQRDKFHSYRPITLEQTRLMRKLLKTQEKIAACEEQQ